MPSTKLFASEAESRSFAYFETRACHDLGGSFHWQFWAREILQAAVHYPATRHLVVAIGAAYEGYQGRGGEGTTSEEAWNLSIEQSNLSIQLMGALFDTARTERQSTETTCNILAASILFAYLACLQGHVSQAVSHVRSGLKVLQSFEKSRSLDDAGTAFPVSIEHLRSLLTSIYGQIRCMINDEALASWHRDPLVSAVAPVLAFSSIADAHSYVESLWHNLLAFLQYTELQPPTTATELARFNTQHDLLTQALESSVSALEQLSSRRSPAHSSDRDEPAITILRLYHTLISIRLLINPLDPLSRESAFDNLEAELAQMLSYCELLASAQSSPSFSSGLGYIMPLHTIAARCRNPCIRRRALHLLQTSRRREGLWDAVSTGKIVGTTIEREERVATLQETSVPGENRVREVKVEFLGERRARIRYVSVKDWRETTDGEEHFLEW